MPSPRFVDGANYGSSYKYVDANPVEGQELAIYTIAPENLNYFIDVTGASLELAGGSEVTNGSTTSKGGSSKVQRFPGDPDPYNRSNVARVIMKNRNVRHGSALPGRKFTLQELGSDGETRTFTYQGTVTALHAILVAHLKVNVNFINYQGAWETIMAPEKNDAA
tara:strand:+ start:414 stop:908 length:495 start_codon:yes stop_codon:yes gene_type:complete